MTIKVLHLIDSGGLYGAEMMLLNLVEEQVNSGLCPLILSAGTPDVEEKALEVEARRRGLPVKPYRMGAGVNFNKAYQIISFAKSEGFNILHSHGYKFNILLGFIPKFLHDLPLITTVHGYVNASFPSRMWAYEKLDRLLLNRFDKVVLVSNKMRELTVFKEINADRLHVIHNGIKNEKPIKKNRNHSEKVLSVRLLAVGRLSPEKGFDFLINAVSELRRKNIDCTLTIIGTGSLFEALSEQAKILDISESVSMPGYVDNWVSIFDDIDLVVMPSLTEGVPITILESFQSGIPIIASQVGGIPEVLGEDSLMFLKSENVESIVNKVIWWTGLSSEKKYEITQLQYNSFKEKFTSKMMESKYRKLYFDLKGKGRIT